MDLLRSGYFFDLAFWVAVRGMTGFGRLQNAKGGGLRGGWGLERSRKVKGFVEFWGFKSIGKLREKLGLKRPVVA